ncbi:unnamed protein product [Durusdinium trenchii]|uniref:Uncharacterized protein n=1 Tax=Durusdinium trenchii TaxID=1381693 RepID=A0ABP0RUY5_9DINO
MAERAGLQDYALLADFLRWGRWVRYRAGQRHGIVSHISRLSRANERNHPAAAKPEAEHMDLEKINAKDGVAYILSCVKGPLEQKLLYQKRMLLSNYENIAQQGHVERDLQSVGISSAAMYDAESRGNCILERCKLDPSLQRLVLIGAQCNLDFDSIVESLQLQFPDFRPTPAVDPADEPCSETLHDIPEEEAHEEFFEKFSGRRSIEEQKRTSARSACGAIWGTGRVTQPAVHQFQFGAGGAQTAAERCYMPASFRGQETQGVLFGVSILPLPIPTLSRIALCVKNEIAEEQHRREENANEVPQDSSSKTNCWPSDALRFVADPPKGVNPAARRSIVDLMRDSPTLLKRASFVPLEATGGFDFLRKDWVKAVRVIRDSSERLKDDLSSWALFEEIERVVEDDLRIEEVQKLSLDQVLVIDGDRAKEADIDTLDAYKGMLLEFKPDGGSAVPIARIKALSAEPFFVGHKDGKLFLAFLPGQLVMNNISEKLAKALLWIAVKKLSPEDQAQFRKSDYGFTDKARTFVGQLRMAIQDQSPHAVAPVTSQFEEDMVVPMEQLEKPLGVKPHLDNLGPVHRVYTPSTDEDYYESWGSGVDDLTDEPDPDEGDISAVEDLLEHAEYAQLASTSLELVLVRPSVTPCLKFRTLLNSVQSQLDTLHETLLSPNLPYYVAESRSNYEGVSSSLILQSSLYFAAKAAKDPRDLDKLSRSRPKDFNFSTLPAFVPDKEELGLPFDLLIRLLAPVSLLVKWLQDVDDWKYPNGSADDGSICDITINEVVRIWPNVARAVRDGEGVMKAFALVAIGGCHHLDPDVEVACTWHAASLGGKAPFAQKCLLRRLAKATANGWQGRSGFGDAASKMAASTGPAVKIPLSSTLYEGEQDDFQTVSITNVEEFVVFCIVCHLQQLETGRMDCGMLGVFLKELVRPAPKLQKYGKLTALVRSHPDKLCLWGADGARFVSLRNGPCPSLPTLDHEAQSDDQFQSGEQDIDLEEEEETINRSSEEQSPRTLLFELANRYLTRRLGGYKGALGTESCEQDANVLAQRFSRSVQDHGILMPDVVLTEIDHACSMRKISEDAQRQAGFIFWVFIF